MDNYGYMEANEVVIDFCGACRLLWLDTHELGAMYLQYARTEKREDYTRIKREIDRLQSIRNMNAVAVADGIGRLLVSFMVYM